VVARAHAHAISIEEFNVKLYARVEKFLGSCLRLAPRQVFPLGL